jgi:hypothetical protein
MDKVELRSNEPPISALAAIFGIIAGLAGVRYWLFSRPSPLPSALPPNITAQEQSIAAGGSITATAQPGCTAIITTGNVTIEESEKINDPLQRAYRLQALRELNFIQQL